MADVKDQAIGMLAHFALSKLWESDGEGCCHVCCAACAALLDLDDADELQRILDAWPEGARGNSMFNSLGELNRAWMHSQWQGSEMQKGCGHALNPPTPGRKR